MIDIRNRRTRHSNSVMLQPPVIPPVLDDDDGDNDNEDEDCDGHYRRRRRVPPGTTRTRKSRPFSSSSLSLLLPCPSSSSPSSTTMAAIVPLLIIMTMNMIMTMTDVAMVESFVHLLPTTMRPPTRRHKDNCDGNFNHNFNRNSLRRLTPTATTTTTTTTATTTLTMIQQHHQYPESSISSSSRSSSSRRRSKQCVSYFGGSVIGARLASSSSSLALTSPSSLSSSMDGSSSSSSSNNPDEDSNNNNNNSDDVVGYEGLYEFLTKKRSTSGEEYDENERRRTLLGWMGGGSNSGATSSNTGSSSDQGGKGDGGRPVQPLRVEDGQVDVDLLQGSAATTRTTTPQKQRARARFDKLFSGMPSLDNILGGPSSSSTNTNTKNVGASASSSSGDGDEDDDDDNQSSPSAVDDSWFDDERKQIEREYEQILQDAKINIQQQRQQQQQEQEGGGGGGAAAATATTGGEVILDNAEGIVESIIKQEMNQKIEQVRKERVRQRIQEYEQLQLDNIITDDSNSSIGGGSSGSGRGRGRAAATDNVVDRILQEAADQWDRRDKLQQQQDDFAQYERQLRQKLAADAAAATAKSSSSSVDTNDDNNNNNDDDDGVDGGDNDIDAWALQRLEEMLDASRRDDNVNGNYGLVEDILEDNIDDLRRRMDKESRKGNIKPTTMKEWQMYRSIATRLAQKQQQQQQQLGNDDKNYYDDDRNGGYGYNVDEDQVARQLQSWKEYVEKEDQIRRRSGLASGPKLPFDYLGAKADRIDNGNAAATAAVSAMSSSSTSDQQQKSRREVRRDINIKSVQAMEDLIKKSDAVRAANLQRGLDALKAELESRDYNDIEREDDADESDLMGLPQPVDLSDVFSISRQEGEDNRERAGLPPSQLAEMKKILASDDGDEEYRSSGSIPLSSFFGDPARLQNSQPPPPSPPDTAFFRDDRDTDEDYYRPPPPPNSPFFQEMYGGRGNNNDEVDVDNKLGSVDEQKLQAMFRRAGARTKEEQDRIREEWEAFQSFEKESRIKSGLSGDEGSDAGAPSLMDGIGTNYNISEVMKDDGDFDAEKILSSIGPRPTKRSNRRKSVPDDVFSTDVADSLYRSIAAADGGRGKEDPSYKEKDRALFDEYLAKENSMRNSLDELDSNAAEVVKSMDIADDQSYAKNVLAASPRPVFQRKQKRVLDEKELSDRGGIFYSEDDDYVDDDDLEEVSSEDSSPMIDDLVPGWLKKEREAAAKARDDKDQGGFLGSDIDDAFPDDTYEHNLRQLHEYEQRRSGRTPMGIDISDIFGRRGSDDYVDYTYDTDYLRGRQNGWGASTFEARKANLLQYVELSIPELNNLMAYKDSPFATGVSQYLPRINKPFKEFGAIFKMEGVLIDITGLQNLVWKRIVAEFEFKHAIDDDIKRAAVTRPEIVVREILYGANDVVIVRQVVDAYRKFFREEFDKWAHEEGLTTKTISPQQPTESPSKGSLAMGFEDTTNDNPVTLPVSAARYGHAQDEVSWLRYLKKSWTRTAQQFGFDVPTDEQIAESAIVTPDIAVRSIFEWTDDQLLISQIVTAHSILQAGDQDPGAARPAQSAMTYSSPSAVDEENFVDESSILELQFTAWKSVAENNALPAPNPEEILAASVLNDPEAVVADGFGWASSPTGIRDLANQYRDNLFELLNKRFDSKVSAGLLNKLAPSPATSVDASKSEQDQDTSSFGPSPVEILESQINAWKETARKHSFDAPSTEKIQAAMNMNPADAVRQVITMDYDIDDLTLKDVTDSYIEALQKLSLELMKRYNLSPGGRQNQSSLTGTVTKSSPGVVSDDEIYRAIFDAWTKIAWTQGYPAPDQEQVLFAMSVGPEEAILAGFRWTDDPATAQEISKMYLDQIKTKREDWHKKGYTTTMTTTSSSLSASASNSMGDSDVDSQQIPLVEIKHGVHEWIQSLRAVEMGCGVVSYLEDDQLNILLEYAGLSELFPPEVRVSHSLGYDRDSQQLLGAALRIERRPDHCVLFDTSPYSSSAAHEVEMRSVAMVGPYPRYELLAADTSASSFDELTAMNIRRLFGERVSDQPMFEQQSAQPDTTKKIKTKYEWAGGDD